MGSFFVYRHHLLGKIPISIFLAFSQRYKPKIRISVFWVYIAIKITASPITKCQFDVCAARI
jgi:hypothetical protein